MKKIIIALAGLAIAMSANAATIKWTFYTNAATWNGYSVYAVSALSEFTSVSDIESAMVGAGSAATITGSRSYSATANYTGSWSAGESVSFYYVIVDKEAEKYWTSGLQSATAVTTGTPTASTFAAADGAALLSTAGTAFAGSPVPEPTSGLLMLLGVAGLALRRRRA